MKGKKWERCDRVLMHEILKSFNLNIYICIYVHKHIYIIYISPVRSKACKGYSVSLVTAMDIVVRAS